MYRNSDEVYDADKEDDKKHPEIFADANRDYKKQLRRFGISSH